MASAEFTSQGTIAVTGTIIHTAPTNGISKSISIRVSNPAAYDITLTKYDASTATSINVYTLNLAAGDVMTDNLVYLLNANDYIELTSTVPGTTYVIFGYYTVN
jgi:hypothetical protein